MTDDLSHVLYSILLELQLLRKALVDDDGDHKPVPTFDVPTPRFK